MAISTLLSVTAGKHSQKVSIVIKALDNIKHFTLIELQRTLQLRTVEYCFKCIAYETFPSIDHMLCKF